MGNYKGIKTIIVANILEVYHVTYVGLNPKERDYWKTYDMLDANRGFLYDGDDKVVITSKPVNEEILQKNCELFGWENAHNLYPQSPTECVSKDIINDPKLLEVIEEIIKTNKEVDLIPYRTTGEFSELVDYLRNKGLKFNTPETLDKDFEFIGTYANSKRGFRHIWTEFVNDNVDNNKITIPRGFIMDSKESAIEAGWFFRVNGKGFVIKYNIGTQGIGVLIFKKEDLPEEKASFVKYVEGKMTEDMWDKGIIVVEEFINIDKNKLNGSPSLEYLIDKNGNLKYSYACEQVLGEDGKTFKGIYVHPQLSKSKYIKWGLKGGNLFGKGLAKLGYRGCFDIDLVISNDDKVYAVESNLRRTGGTHIHHAAVSLLGKDYYKKYYVLSEDIDLGEQQFDVAKLRSTLSDLEYDKKTYQGIIYSNIDMISVKLLNVLFVAKSDKAIQQLRQEVRKRLRINE